jgi:hypothetical protein
MFTLHETNSSLIITLLAMHACSFQAGETSCVSIHPFPLEPKFPTFQFSTLHVTATEKIKINLLSKVKRKINNKKNPRDQINWN